jgi:hypothetical protein
MPYIDVLPTKSAIFEHWKDRLPGLGIFIAWREPSCWACGFLLGATTRYDIKRPDAAWAKILQCWEKIKLQRCHIVPQSLGGSDEVSNLFLMCRECHDMQPNTTIPDIFFEWARVQSAAARDTARMLNAFMSYGIRPNDLSALESIQTVMDSPEFKAWASGKFGLHRPQSNYATTMMRLTPATMIGLAIHYRRWVACMPVQPKAADRPTGWRE